MVDEAQPYSLSFPSTGMPVETYKHGHPQPRGKEFISGENCIDFLENGKKIILN